MSSTAATPSAPTPNLADLIRDEAAAELATLRAQTEAHVQRIRAAAAAEAESLRTAARRAGEERGRRQAAKRLAAATTETHRQWLWEREALIQQVLTQARAHLQQLPSLPDAGVIVAALIHESTRALPPGPVCVRLPESYEPLLDATLTSAVAAAGWTLDITHELAPSAGAIVETADGRLRFDNSIDARIRRRVDRLRRRIADVLFSDQGHTP